MFGIWVYSWALLKPLGTTTRGLPSRLSGHFNRIVESIARCAGGISPPRTLHCSAAGRRRALCLAGTDGTSYLDAGIDESTCPMRLSHAMPSFETV